MSRTGFLVRLFARFPFIHPITSIRDGKEVHMINTFISGLYKILDVSGEGELTVSDLVIK